MVLQCNSEIRKNEVWLQAGCCSGGACFSDAERDENMKRSMGGVGSFLSFLAKLGILNVPIEQQREMDEE